MVLSLEILVAIAGGIGALALRVLGLPKVLDKGIVARQIDNLKDYLSALTERTRERADQEWARINDLQDKIAIHRDSSLDKVEREFRAALRWHLAEWNGLRTIEKLIADRRAKVYSTIAQLKYWGPGGYLLYSVLYVIVGTCLAWLWFQSRGTVFGLDNADTGKPLGEAFFIGMAWPLYVTLYLWARLAWWKRKKEDPSKWSKGTVDFELDDDLRPEALKQFRDDLAKQEIEIPKKVYE